MRHALKMSGRGSATRHKLTDQGIFQMTGRMLAAMATVLCATTLAPRIDAAENFQKLSGAQIQARVSGMEFTDEVHWRDVFERNGTLTSFSMGRKSVGKWR